MNIFLSLKILLITNKYYIDLSLYSLLIVINLIKNL